MPEIQPITVTFINAIVYETIIHSTTFIRRVQRKEAY